MTRQQLLKEHIFVPSSIDESIITNLLMGNDVLCYVHFEDTKDLMCLRLIEDTDKSPINTFSLYSNYLELDMDNVIYLKGNWYDIVPNDLPTLLKHFKHD